MSTQTKLAWFMALLVWIGLFTYVGLKTIDPDFGWHLQMGRLIRLRGLPATDPFSYTMPSYPFIDHEWLTNLFMADIHDAFGYQSLAVVFGLLTGILFLLLAPPKKLIFAGIPLLLSIGVWWSRGGIRPQVIDWVFLALLLQLIWSDSRWSRFKWFFPPLFALWANTHGGFALGPAVLGFILFFKALQSRSLVWSDWVVWLFSVIATFANPYGPRLWHEVWMQMTDTGLRVNISEWQPFWARAELGIWLLAALAYALFSRFRSTTPWWQPALLLVFTLAGASSLRHMSLLAVVSTLFVTDLIEQVYLRISSDTLSLRRARQFYLLLCTISVLVVFAEIGVSLWRFHSGAGIIYPHSAINFLKSRNFPGQLFSDYGWGGYLIWQYPEKPVFIDGRMPSFRWSPPPGESSWAFQDYLEVADKGNFSAVFSQYDVRIVLWPKSKIVSPGNLPAWNLAKLIPWLHPPDPRPGLVTQLESAGWPKVYEDTTSVVYVHPSTVK